MQTIKKTDKAGNNAIKYVCVKFSAESMLGTLPFRKSSLQEKDF